MATTEDIQGFRGRMQRLESLIQGIDRCADPAARAQSRETIQALLDLHACGFENVLALLSEAGESGRALIDRLAEDEIVSGLLLLYGLHPRDLESRVRLALDKVRPYLHSHGGDVELVSIVGAAVRLRMQGSCHGCPSSAMTLKSTIEAALYEQAPDLESLEVEGGEAPAAAPATTFVPVAELSMRNGKSKVGSGAGTAFAEN